MIFKLLVTGAMACALAGCANEKFVGRPSLQVVQSDGELPPPQREDILQQQRPYLIGPYDKVVVNVFGMPDLTQTVQVDANGTIALPLVGEVTASGETPAQLASAIAERLQRYVRAPQVTVNVDTINQVITVDGQVNKPGLYPVAGRMTLIRAVATAQGSSQYANERYVVVFRKVGGRDMAALYDLSSIRQGVYPDPEIYPNDIVYVGESRARRIFQDVISSSALLTGPLIAVLN
jgi:polysaccharide biosynthesis/export protein